MELMNGLEGMIVLKSELESTNSSLACAFLLSRMSRVEGRISEMTSAADLFVAN